MNAKLLEAASVVIPNKQMLVNVISRRVKQLARGHRPLIEFVPGMGLADVALTEVIDAKLTYELTPIDGVTADAEKVLEFPTGTRKKVG